MQIAGKVAALSAVAMLAACAVQELPGGRVSVGVDDAELLGHTEATFQLADGSQARLRLYNGQYSIKLEHYLKVIPIEQAQLARMVSGYKVAGRTLLILEKSSSNCPYQTQVISIHSSEALSWDVGDCLSQPKIQVAPDQATFDFAQGDRTLRYIYKDNRLVKGDLFNPVYAGPTPVAPASAEPSNRYVPGLPLKADGVFAGTSTPTPAPTSAASATAVAAKPAAPRPAPAVAHRAAAPVFAPQEQTAVRIVLDK